MNENNIFNLGLVPKRPKVKCPNCKIEKETVCETIKDAISCENNRRNKIIKDTKNLQ